MEIVKKLKAKITTSLSDEPDDQEPSSEPIQRQLSDDGVVLRQLIKNNGQIQRSELLEHTGWDTSKADDVLTTMEKSGDVRVVDNGNTTLICRPGYEPAGHQKI